MYNDRLKLSIIVAAAKGGVIGLGGKLPWRMPADLLFFKNTTWGSALIMGRKTYLCMLSKEGKPLPGRKSIVVTSLPQTEFPQEAAVCASLEAAFSYCIEKLYCKHAFVVGGGQLYAAALPFIDELIYTEIEADFPQADAFFPALDLKEWRLTSKRSFEADEKNPYAYSFLTYNRI